MLKLTDSDTGAINEDGSTFTQPVNEKQLVNALTEHAHKIAESILSRPGTGMDLALDAKVRQGWCCLTTAAI